MMVLCILLAMLSLFLSLKLIYQRKLVQKVKKQIDFLIDRDTQTEIMVEKTDGTIQDLAASINHLLKKYRSMGQEIERSDTLFRDTLPVFHMTCERRWQQQMAISSSYRNRI